MKRNHVRRISVRFQTPTILVVVAIASMISVGCGGGNSGTVETTGGELEQFLEDNPDIRDAEGEEFDGEY